jgi:hypothetical protein
MTTRARRYWLSLTLSELCVLPFMALAQGSDISGVVSDSVTTQRIPFANVILINTPKGVATNNAGFYLLSNVPEGTYEIAVSIIGYREKVRRVTVNSGTRIVLNFDIVAVPIEGQEVLITGSRRRELTEVSTSLHLLEQKELKMTPALAQDDVLQSLKILAGIVSTSDVSSKFYVRGGAGDQNLFLLDGMKIYNPFHAFGIFSVLDPDIVHDVTIYTGSSPAGYGGRLSSAIDIRTQDGRADRIAGRANMNFLSSKVELEGPAFAGTSWMFNGRKSLFSETFKTLVKQDLPASFEDVFFKFRTHGAAVMNFAITALSSSDKLFFASPNEPDYYWRNTVYGVSFSDLMGDRLFTEVVGYNTTYRARRDAKSSGLSGATSTSVTEPSVRGQATYYTDAQDLFFFGFEFSFPSFEYDLVNKLGVAKNLSSSSAEMSTWIRYQGTYGPLKVDAGLHVEAGALLEQAEGLEAIQPRLNASYLLFGDWRVKTSFGIFTQRHITVSNEDDILSLFDAWIKVPDNVRREEAVHYVVGVSGNIVEALSLSAESYHKDYSRLVVYNRDKVDATEPDYVVGSGRSSGAELQVRWKLSFVDLYANYSLSWTILNNSGLEYHPRYDQRHHVNLLGVAHALDGLDLKMRWEFGSGFQFTPGEGYYDRMNLLGSLPGAFQLETGQPYLALGAKNSTRLPMYHRLDLSAEYRFSILGFKVAAGVQVINVYDNRNVFYFDRNTGQRVDMLRFFPSAMMTVEY